VRFGVDVTISTVALMVERFTSLGRGECPAPHGPARDGRKATGHLVPDFRTYLASGPSAME
jgi:hypothetical protein